MRRPAPSPRRQKRGRKARRVGRWAEFLCVMLLLATGWRILARGAVTGRGTGAGEIDIVARRGQTVAFIEVKARPTLAEAAGAISPLQRERLVRAAGAFLARRPELGHCAPRFDAMLVAPGGIPRHIKDAWRTTG